MAAAVGVVEVEGAEEAVGAEVDGLIASAEDLNSPVSFDNLAQSFRINLTDLQDDFLNLFPASTVCHFQSHLSSFDNF